MIDLGAACSAGDSEGHHRPQPYLSVRLHRQQVRVPYRWALPVSIACANVMLNTAVAEALRQFADELEGAEDFEAALHELTRKSARSRRTSASSSTATATTSAWVAEAEKRGLLNFKSAADAFPHYVDQKNLDLFAKHDVYTSAEMLFPYGRPSLRSTTRSCTSRL